MAKRQHIGLKVKLAAALACLLPQEDRDLYRHNKVSVQYILSKFEWDHLILKAHNGPDDWWNLDPKLKAIHREKSRKDTAIVAKTKRLEKAQAEHKERMTTSRFLLAGGTKPEPYRWPTRKIANRPFPKAHRPLRGKR